MIATVSAIGNAHHTNLTSPLKEIKYATGKITTSCLMMDIIILYTAYPRAWNALEHAIPIAANRKLKQIGRAHV